MNKAMKIVTTFLFCSVAASYAWSEEEPTATQPPKGTIHYKEVKDLNFDQLIIEGQMKRPELSVVTGDDEQGTNGLLKLREDFIDKMTVDASEQIP